MTDSNPNKTVMKHFVKGLLIGLVSLAGLYTILIAYGPGMGLNKYPFLLPFTIAHVLLIVPLVAFFRHKREKNTIQGILFFTGIVYLLISSCYWLLSTMSFH